MMFSLGRCWKPHPVELSCIGIHIICIWAHRHIHTQTSTSYSGQHVMSHTQPHFMLQLYIWFQTSAFNCLTSYIIHKLNPSNTYFHKPTSDLFKNKVPYLLQLCISWQFKICKTVLRFFPPRPSGFSLYNFVQHSDF